MSADTYPLAAERVYATHPGRCRAVHVLFVGSAIALGSVRYLLDQFRALSGDPIRVAVADAGPLDILTHMAHQTGPRAPFLANWTDHFGGKLGFWGMSTPRPPADRLATWPYDQADLTRRFESVEKRLGVHDIVPLAARDLELELLARLRDRFPNDPISPAPLAINRDCRRYSPLDEIPALVQDGVRLLPRFRVDRLVRTGNRVTAVCGQWHDGRRYTLRPDVAVLATGGERSLPLVRQVTDGPLDVEAADHLRLDLHGRLPVGAFGPQGIEELGVAILVMNCRGRDFGTPYHLEIKVAPVDLWRRGYMQSSDNLRGTDPPGAIYVQVQAVCAMHDRLPTTDILQREDHLPAVMSARDAVFHGEVVGKMLEVAAVLGLADPRYSFRPLLTNHHTYGVYRVGKAVTCEFRLQGTENLYILPPSAFVDVDDDANPTLKSLVLAQYAMDDIARQVATSAAAVSLANRTYVV